MRCRTDSAVNSFTTGRIGGLFACCSHRADNSVDRRRLPARYSFDSTRSLCKRLLLSSCIGQHHHRSSRSRQFSSAPAGSDPGTYRKFELTAAMHIRSKEASAFDASCPQHSHRRTVIVPGSPRYANGGIDSRACGYTWRGRPSIDLELPIRLTVGGIARTCGGKVTA